ncbi:MAG: hypothetical protein R3A44_15565 [Caldilineaceae bacterium]
MHGAEPIYQEGERVANAHIRIVTAFMARVKTALFIRLYIFTPSLGAQDGGANAACGAYQVYCINIDKELSMQAPLAPTYLRLV